MGKRWRRRGAPNWLQVFMGKGCVALTDELIAELVATGWDRADLLFWKAEGAVYDKARDVVLKVGKLGAGW